MLNQQETLVYVDKMEKQNTKIYWIVGLIVVGLILYNNNPEMFAISNVTYQQRVSSLNGINLNQCWNSKLVIGISDLKDGKYTIYYVRGCNKVTQLNSTKNPICTKLIGKDVKNKKTINVFIRSDVYSQQKIQRGYVTTLSNIMKMMDSPVKDYNYVYYYQSSKDACSNMSGYNDEFNIKINIGYSVISWLGTHGYYDGEVQVQYDEPSGTMAHEIGHAFGLPDAYFGNYVKLHPEYKNNLMNKGMSVGAKFTKDQKNLIIMYMSYYTKQYKWDYFYKHSGCDLTREFDKTCTQQYCTLTGGKWYTWGQCVCDESTQTWNSGCKYNPEFVEIGKLRNDYNSLYSKLNSVLTQ
jgi:hypothetical protein